MNVLWPAIIYCGLNGSRVGYSTHDSLLNFHLILLHKQGSIAIAIDARVLQLPCQK